jgi:hypothetical protein
MRILIVRNAADIATLKAGGTPVLTRLQALNPHVDLDRLETGATLLLPDDAPADNATTKAPTEDGFAGFVRQAEAGLKLSGERLKQTADTLSAERSAVTTAAKSAAVKRLLDSDTVLRTQLQAATDDAAQEQKQAQQAGKTVETLQQVMASELAALGKLIG